MLERQHRSIHIDQVKVTRRCHFGDVPLRFLIICVLSGVLLSHHLLTTKQIIDLCKLMRPVRSSMLLIGEENSIEKSSTSERKFIKNSVIKVG